MSTASEEGSLAYPSNTLNALENERSNQILLQSKTFN